MNKKFASLALCAALASGPAVASAPTAQAAGTGVRGFSSTSATSVKVTAKSSAQRAKAGQKITLTGQAPARSTIVVQYQYSGRWYSLPGKARATARGTYAVSIKHVRNSAVLYRVAAVVGKKTVYSGRVGVALAPTARSYWLADYRGVEDGLYRESTAILGSQTVTQALIEDGTYASQWRVNRSCTNLTGLAGAAADDSTRVMKVEVMGDGRILYSRAFNPGEIENVKVSLRGVELLTIGVVEMEQGSGDVNAGIGNVQVTCTASPGEYSPL